MKMYNLFIATFVVLVNFTIEDRLTRKKNKNTVKIVSPYIALEMIHASSPDLEVEINIKQYLQTSYEDEVEILETNKLQYLVKDLDRLYEIGYGMMIKLWDFFYKPKNMHDLLVKRSRALECMKNELSGTIASYENLIVKLFNDLEIIPKNQTCYTDLVKNFKDIKDTSWKMMANHETYEKTNVTFFELKEALEIIHNDTLKAQYDIKNWTTNVVEDYVQNMVGLLENKTTKRNILKQSQKSIELFKMEADKYIQYLREEGILNVTLVKGFCSLYQTIRMICYEEYLKLLSNMNAMESLILSGMAIMEKYMNATFYIIDEENNHIPLDCDDHVPYFGARPTENVISHSQKDGRYILYVTGVDENRRKYKRELKIIELKISADILGPRITVIEKIEYGDKVLVRKYFVSFGEVVVRT